LRRSGTGGQFPQQTISSILEESERGFLDDIQDSFNCSLLSSNGIEAVIEVTFLGIAEPLHR
jgi:hypothetical protein